MIVNAITLVALCVAMYVIAKVKKDKLRTWLDKTHMPNDVKSAMGDVLCFWRSFFKKIVRIIAFAFFLVFQKNVWCMLVCASILIGVSYYLAAKMKVLQNIDWGNRKVQKIATLTMISLSLVSLINKFEILGLIGSFFIFGFVLCLGIPRVYFFYNSRKNREQASNQGKTPYKKINQGETPKGEPIKPETGGDSNNESDAGDDGGDSDDETFVGDDGGDSNNESDAGDDGNNSNNESFVGDDEDKLN